MKRSIMTRRGLALACLVVGLTCAEAGAGDDAGDSSGSASLAAQARQALAKLRREAARCGLKLSKRATADDPSSYRVVLEASPFQLAFYADAGPLLAPLPSASGWSYAGSQVKFPDPYSGVRLRVKKWGAVKPTDSAADYFERLDKLGDAGAKLPMHLSRNAEVLVYTLDGNGDGRVDATDKQAPPAAATPNVYDVALLRLVYGTEVTDGNASAKQTQSVVARGIRVWLEQADGLARGGKPRPAFIYRLSERFAGLDFNDDGDEEDQLVFGDSNGDGKLDDSENEALLKSNSQAATDLVDNLSVDARFAAANQGGNASSGLIERIRKQHPTLSEADAKQFIKNAIVRVDVRLLLDYEDPQRDVRVRKRILGRADFRNAIMRLRGMTR